MNVCLNNVFRKIFSMNAWESVKCLQLLCGRLDFIHIAFQRKLKFLNGLYKASSLAIKECFRYARYNAKFKKLCEDCDMLIEIDVCNLTFVRPPISLWPNVAAKL